MKAVNKVVSKKNNGFKPKSIQQVTKLVQIDGVDQEHLFYIIH